MKHRERWMLSGLAGMMIFLTLFKNHAKTAMLVENAGTLTIWSLVKIAVLAGVGLICLLLVVLAVVSASQKLRR
jgi:hypothetical protein